MRSFGKFWKEQNLNFDQAWHDPRLAWNRTDSFPGGSVQLDTDPELDPIWLPDFWLYNAAERPMESMAAPGAIVTSTGWFGWSQVSFCFSIEFHFVTVTKPYTPLSQPDTCIQVIWFLHGCIRFLIFLCLVWEITLRPSEQTSRIHDDIQGEHNSHTTTTRGLVKWSRPGLLRASCEFDLQRFPFDGQRCRLSLGSWVYASNNIRLLTGAPRPGDGRPTLVPAFTSGRLDFADFDENSEWIVEVDEVAALDHEIARKAYGLDPDSIYETWTVYLSLGRRSAYYQSIFVFPAIAIAFTILFAMLIPYEIGERISYATTMTLTLTVFLMIVSEHLPKTEPVPTLSRMLSYLLYGALLFLACIIAHTAWSQQKDEKQEELEKAEDKKLARNNMLQGAVLGGGFTRSASNRKLSSRSASGVGGEKEVGGKGGEQEGRQTEQEAAKAKPGEAAAAAKEPEEAAKPVGGGEAQPQSTTEAPPVAEALADASVRSPDALTGGMKESE